MRDLWTHLGPKSIVKSLLAHRLSPGTTLRAKARRSSRHSRCLAALAGKPDRQPCTPVSAGRIGSCQKAQSAVGLNGSIEDLPLSDDHSPELVADLVYRPTDPPVTAWARGRAAKVVDGLEVLLRQGVLSFVRWTGQDPPLDRMREAVRVNSEPSFVRVRFRH